MARLSAWVGGARPRTLPAAVVPVGVGTAVAGASGRVDWPNAALALVVALSMQVGTNYANDYSDGVRGTDEVRVGPARLVAGGIASPRSVKAAALASFGIGASAGLALSILTTPWLLPLGAVCIAAGWLYTGGPKPYGYAGYGELFVFVFFGLVATCGTAYVASGQLPALSFAAAVPVGLLAVALLVANNLRDLATDGLAGKATLAVRIGPHRTRLMYAGCVLGAVGLGALVGLVRPWAVITLAVAPLTLVPLRRVLGGADGRELVAVLVATGVLQLVLGALLGVGIVL